MSGARARVGLYDPTTGLTRIVGLFSNVSWNVTYETAPAFILGRFSAAEIDYTSMDPISVTCSGYRVIEHGPYVETGMPKLQDLLTSDYLSLAIIDRQREALGLDGRIGIFKQVRNTGFSTAISARNLEEITATYVCLGFDDESTVNVESPTSTDLP